MLCCPDEEFSLEPVVSLGNGIYRITGVSVEEEDFCNVSKLVISRKESVSAHSHIYLSGVYCILVHLCSRVENITLSIYSSRVYSLLINSSKENLEVVLFLEPVIIPTK